MSSPRAAPQGMSPGSEADFWWLDPERPEVLCHCRFCLPVRGYLLATVALWGIRRETGHTDCPAAARTVRRGHRRRVKQIQQGWRPFRQQPFPAGRENPSGLNPCRVSDE